MSENGLRQKFSRLLILLRIWRFSGRVIRAFMRNRGILLAGGVGYNVLLSTIPLFALLVVLLTHIVDEQDLLNIMAIQVQHLAPGYATLLLDTVQALLDSRDTIGVLGIVVLLFFSSFAFRMLDDSMAIIFHRPDVLARRSTWVSVALPYAFMLVVGAGLLALTMLFTLLSSFTDYLSDMFDVNLPLSTAPVYLLNFASFVGMATLFTGIYKVLPVVQVAWRRALVGGFVAALLWEGARFFLLYYFANISYVNVIYGSVTTVIVVLISLEIAAVILLLGAQVIAELERSARHAVPWHKDPRHAEQRRMDDRRAKRH
ncbi:YihY/virulence factor BrkB family protein [Salinispirillum sp. LH 10-3-1]|uniref:YihY/virulence factor BrkB family protein n=1 Tax=Salinispirillum sp. LH 10-3-1 TaxID=2952525 RepID=A0AB38YCW5_9GAMM